MEHDEDRIEAIKEELRKEGYTSETIEGVLIELRRSFLADDARSFAGRMRMKAAEFEAALALIYSAVEEEPIVDIKLESAAPLTFPDLKDYFDLRLKKNETAETAELVISWVSRSPHPSTAGSGFELGTAASASIKRLTPRTIELLVIRCGIHSPRPALALKRFFAAQDGSPKPFNNIRLNRGLTEGTGKAVPAAAVFPFPSAAAFIDFITGMYRNDGYRELAAELSSLHGRVAAHFAEKRRMLDNLDFSGE